MGEGSRHGSTSATLLGNVAYRSKSYIEWDAEAAEKGG
jgi:hypothetical protein